MIDKYKEAELDKPVMDFWEEIKGKVGEVEVASDDFLNEEKVSALLEKDKKTGLNLTNARNLELVLTNGKLKETFFYDEFRMGIYVKKDLPWREIPKGQKFLEWTEDEEKRLQHYLDRHYDIAGRSKIRNAIHEIAKRNAINPLREYIKGEKWDGINRIETILIDFLGAYDSKYVREVSKVFFTAAVARAFEPGVKYDYMVILVGEQGLRKSSFIELIGGEWYSSGPPNFNAKIAGEIMQIAWIFELPELTALKNSSVEETKAFITKKYDEYRPAYAVNATQHLRKCVLIGTTNEIDFLKDNTGNRRFLPIDLEIDRVKHDFAKLTPEYLKQVWAEAYQLYCNGQPLFLSEELTKYAFEEQEKHYEEDPKKLLIDDFVNMARPNDWSDMTVEDRHRYFYDYLSKIQGSLENEIIEDRQTVNEISPIEIRKECFGKFDNNFTSHESKEIGQLLGMLGWKLGNQKRKRLKYYGQQKLYFRPNK